MIVWLNSFQSEATQKEEDKTQHRRRMRKIDAEE
jgi:hypothetical protein